MKKCAAELRTKPCKAPLRQHSASAICHQKAIYGTRHAFYPSKTHTAFWLIHLCRSFSIALFRHLVNSFWQNGKAKRDAPCGASPFCKCHYGNGSLEGIAYYIIDGFSFRNGLRPNFRLSIYPVPVIPRLNGKCFAIIVAGSLEKIRIFRTNGNAVPLLY